MTLAAWVTVFAVVLVGSTGSGGFVYWLLNRNSQQVQDSKTKADRESVLADAAAKWQALIDESSTEAYQKVEKRCKRCEDDLTSLVGTLGGVLPPFRAFMESVAQLPGVDATLAANVTRTLHVAERELSRHI